MNRAFRIFVPLLSALLLSNCGASGTSADNFDLSIAQRTQAANATVQSNALCNSISAFTWQVGDGNGPLASGTGGSGTPPTADTSMLIASASKWLWGAYVVQLRNGQLTLGDVASLTMNSGYTSLQYSNCLKLLPILQNAETVQECFNNSGNNTHSAQYDGKFFYNGGHFQKYAAVDLGLGGDNNAALQSAIALQIGQDIPFSYNSPQLAGGAQTTANGYAIFLRKILNNQLKIHDLLGSNAVCTNPSTCATAVYSPVNDPSSPVNTESWHYSLAHWVEDDPTVGDGAYSSTGAFGFYPWIDKNKTTYGLLARYSTGAQASTESLRCGRRIRKAWFSGQQQ